MSDKLLHEKMRELAETRMCPELSSITLNNGKKVTRLTSEELTGLADEIERYYIPRPRFEDGEPVQFGDSFLRWDGKNGNDGENVVEIAVQSGDYYRWGLNGDCCASQFVKRPVPKVFDADGVPIEVGDTVWFCGDDSGRYTVLTVEPTLGGNWCLTVFNDTATIHEVRPSQVTHHEPDSLEKLRDDMRRAMAESPDARFMDSSWVDRLTTLMERGA